MRRRRDSLSLVQSGLRGRKGGGRRSGSKNRHGRRVGMNQEGSSMGNGNLERNFTVMYRVSKRTHFIYSLLKCSLGCVASHIIRWNADGRVYHHARDSPFRYYHKGHSMGSKKLIQHNTMRCCIMSNSSSGRPSALRQRPQLASGFFVFGNWGVLLLCSFFRFGCCCWLGLFFASFPG